MCFQSLVMCLDLETTENITIGVHCRLPHLLRDGVREDWSVLPTNEWGGGSESCWVLVSISRDPSSVITK